MSREFGPRGLGYAMTLTEFGTELSCSQPLKKGGDVLAEIAIATALGGTRSSTGELHRGRLNFSSHQARGTLARYLKDAAGGPIDGLDWQDLLEDFCSKVLLGERRRREVIRVGDRPVRIAPRFQLAPVVPWRRVTTLFGAGGTGKSTLATAIGVSVQTGITVIPGWVPTPTNVLYLDWETDEDDIDEKVKAIAKGAGIDGAVTLFYLSCHGRSFSDQVEFIAEARQEVDAGLCIVDSVVHAAGTSTSEGADAAESTIRLYNAFGQLDATVLVVDHVDKASSMDPSRPAKPYGSIFKENMARQAFEVRRSDPVGDRSSIGLYNTKSNLSRKALPIGLWIEQSESGDLLKPLSLSRRIDAALREGAMHLRAIAEEVEEDENKVRATLSRGAKDHRYIALGDGNWGLASHAG